MTVMREREEEDEEAKAAWSENGGVPAEGLVEGGWSYWRRARILQAYRVLHDEMPPPFKDRVSY
jgi:hypothetical protein